MSNDIKLVERVVKHKVATYHVVNPDGVRGDGTIGEVVLERMGRRGDTIELRETEARRLDELGAFYTDAELEKLADAGETPADEAPPAPPNADAVDLVALDEDATGAWLKGEGAARRPSVPQVLNAINQVPEDDRAEVAKRVLDAEKLKDPRSSLVEPLEEFLNEEEE